MHALRTLMLTLAALGGAATAQPPGDEVRPSYHREPYPPTAWRPVDAPALAGVPYWLGVDEPPQRFDAYFPAGGPLQRFADRPGAWYCIVFVPVAARWPVQLWAWQRSGSHQLRVLALDGWPGASAHMAVPVPLRLDLGANGRPVVHSAPLVLPAASRAEGVFMLLEQWHPQGARPAAIWLQARSGERDEHTMRPRDSAWWLSAEARPAPAADGHAAAPPGPLSAPRVTASAIELPILRLVTPWPRPAPSFEPWWDR